MKKKRGGGPSLSSAMVGRMAQAGTAWHSLAQLGGGSSLTLPGTAWHSLAYPGTDISWQRSKAKATSGLKSSSGSSS